MIHGHGGNIFELARQLGCKPEDIIDMSSNINPLGPPPGLMDYIKNHLSVINKLPEVDSAEICTAMAKTVGIDPASVVAGAGTTQFIYAMFPVLASKKVLIVGPTYADYADACHLHRIESHYFLAEKDHQFQPDLDQLDRKMNGHDTVVICNPNNPTGVMIPRDRISRLCRNHPDTHFIIDESYLPFVPEADKQSMITSGLDNVMVLCSLSKIFRMPGLRVGFLIAAKAVIQAFKAVMLPWSVNGPAQIAARFIYSEKRSIEEFVDQSRTYIRTQRDRFIQRLSDNPELTVYPSNTSYFLIELPPYLNANEVCARLARQRILIRNCSNFYGLTDQFVRLAMHLPEMNRRVAEKLIELKD